MSGRRAPRRRSGEAGFTLVELLVSLTILALIAVTMGLVYDAGFRALLSPGASNDRLASAHDQEMVEAILSRDVHQAACIEVAAASTDQGPFGSCSGGFVADAAAATPAAGSTALLLVGWPEYQYADGALQGSCYLDEFVATPDLSGHGVVLSLLSRQEYNGVVRPGSSLTLTTDPGDPIGLTGWQVRLTAGGTWITSIQVTLTGPAGSPNQPQGTLQLRPLLADPAISTAELSGEPIC